MLFYTAEIPVFKRIESLESSNLYARTKTLGIFWSLYYNIVKTLDMEYWVTHCGIDGYVYLLLQRRFLRMTIYLATLTLAFNLFSFMVNLGSDLQHR